MKLLLIFLSLMTLLVGGHFSPQLLVNRTFDLSGRYYYYPFYPKDDPRAPFNWVFETRDRRLFQLMGTEPSPSNVFGWKEVHGLSLGNPLWYFFYLGDIDGDGDSRFDWILTPAQGGDQTIYKLREVTPEEHYLRYDGPYLMENRFDGEKISIGEDFAVRVEIPWRENGYNEFRNPIIITNNYDLARFKERVEASSRGWNRKKEFLATLDGIELEGAVLLFYPFSMPSSSITVKREEERFIAPHVFKVSFHVDRPSGGMTADMAYYMVGYLLSESVERVIFDLDGKEDIVSLKSSSQLSCEEEEAPVCGERVVQCIQAPCPPQRETFKNYCTLKKEGGTYLHDGPCSEPRELNTTELVAHINGFGYDLASDIYQGKGNIVISPYSITKVLQTVYLGSDGVTKEEIEELFGRGLELAKGFKEIEPHLRSNRLQEANSAWFEKSFQLYPSYLLKVRDFTGSEIFSVDFLHRAEEVRREINDWVAQRTEIEELLPPNSVNASTRGVLVNTISFRGEWKYIFEEVMKGVFHGEGGDEEVDMLSVEAPFSVYENGELQAIDIPYRDGELSMIILLPKGDRCICDMLAFLKREGLRKLRREMEYRERVRLTMPQFDIQWGVQNLKENLERIGLTTLFNPERANLSLIGRDQNSEGRLYVSGLYHEAQFRVDRKGSEGSAGTAAVVTWVTAAPPSSQNPYFFIVDHNFLFLLVDNRSGVVYFIGGIKRIS
ncbi:MAG: serpin family protein [Epsilonproteobacteria bacterium]|nr:serpin family protein [Campylobacterota bacterium]